MLFIDVLISCAVAGLPLLTIELISRAKKLKPETARKSVHVGSSLILILLANITGLEAIAITGVLYFGLMLSLRSSRLWHSLYRVKRKSWGEILFPISVSGCALIANTPTEFIVAMLILGISDTTASLVGQKYGRPHKYHNGGLKTMAGSAAFFVTSMLILIAFYPDRIAIMVITALVTTLAEYLSVDGWDNLSVPVVCLLLLGAL